jgi:23S rRNA (guanosine2251-2'-O)-methyltransferase
MSEYLYGANTAEEVINGGRRKIFRVMAARGQGKGAAAADLARKKGIRVEFVDNRVLEKYAPGANHQGIVLEVEPLRHYSSSEALALEKDPKRFLWAGVDGITDPMNLGAILRSAACFGVSSVLLPERRTVGITPTVQKTSSGALEKLNIVPVGNLNSTIIDLKERGVWVYGLDTEGEPLDKVDYAFPGLILVGSEGEGLHLKTKEHCDRLISIPQLGGVESLNASAAAAVAFYEVSKKLRASGGK